MATTKFSSYVKENMTRQYRCFRDQNVRFAYVTSLWVEGKQTRVLRKSKTVNDVTATFEVLPLGINVCSYGRKFFLICYCHPSDHLIPTSAERRSNGSVPTIAQKIGWLIAFC
jgi:hypothetical protein